MDWKPTVKALGNCPYVYKRDCPFSHRFKMCHGMPLAASHYERSKTDEIDRSML